MLQLVSALTIATCAWTELPQIKVSSFPASKVTGLDRKGDQWLVGSTTGVYLGSIGGKWKQLTKSNVKYMLQVDDQTLALCTDGRLDRFKIPSESVMFDVVSITAKRPWVTSACVAAKVQIWGMEGGYVHRSLRGSPAFTLPNLKGVTVSAVAYRQGTSYLGTANGIYSAKGKVATKISGYSGSVSSLLQMVDGIYIGSASTGLSVYSNNKVGAVACPTKKIRLLRSWRSNLVVGAADGAWVRDGGKWTRLTNQECTFINVIEDRLYVGTPTTIRVFKP